MEGRLGRAINAGRTVAKNIIASFTDPTTRFREGRMSRQEFERRSGGIEGISDRLNAARIAANGITPDATPGERLKIIREAIQKYEQAVHPTHKKP